MKELLTAREPAEILNLSVDTIWRYTRQGRIPAVELGERQYRYEREKALAALTGYLTVGEERPVCARQNEYTCEDYLKILKEPGYRYEVLEGILVREPSPLVHHPRVCRVLLSQLMAFFRFGPEGEIFSAPVDVTLTACKVLRPDMLFVSRARRGIMRQERIDGPCDLAVEITSPGNRWQDRLHKNGDIPKGRNS
ncbi:MAG: Uma2 family endonuclease [Bacillota bacterium]